MQPGDPRPAQSKQCAERDKGDEREVNKTIRLAITMQIDDIVSGSIAPAPRR